jgi:hypothetical protein
MCALPSVEVCLTPIANSGSVNMSGIERSSQEKRAGNEAIFDCLSTP